MVLRCKQVWLGIFTTDTSRQQEWVSHLSSITHAAHKMFQLILLLIILFGIMQLFVVLEHSFAVICSIYLRSLISAFADIIILSSDIIMSAYCYLQCALLLQLCTPTVYTYGAQFMDVNLEASESSNV